MSENKTVKCEVCELEVRTTSILKVHMEKEHSKEEEELSCRICSETVYNWNDALKHTEAKHFQTWTTNVGKKVKSKFFVCVTCDKREETEEQMQDHCLKTHEHEETKKSETISNKEDDTMDVEKPFKCEECQRNFKTKQGMKLHITMKHRKAEEREKKQNMKRTRSVEQKLDRNKCKICDFKSKSQFAFKTHMNIKHKEPTSPENKKLKTGDVVEEIISEMVNSVTEKPKTVLEPSKEFLTKTANDLAQMLDDMAGDIDDVEDINDIDEDIDEEDELSLTELSERLEILKGNAKETKKKSMQDFVEDDAFVTIPLKDIDDLRIELRETKLDLEVVSDKLKNTAAENVFLKNQIKEIKSGNNKDHPKEKKIEESTFQCDKCGKKSLTGTLNKSSGT